MRKIFLVLMPAILSAAVTNVRVTGTTATQAVLKYTAPDAAACSVAVSTSASYAPLVRDVDTARFSGANLDSRAGNIVIGRSRIFVVGKRAVERDLTGANSSRALQAATLHYFRINCPSDGSSATGTFTTATVPNGMGYGDPIPIDPANNGSYLYPTFSTTDRTATIVEPYTGVLVRNLTLPGDVQTHPTFNLGSSGTGQMCHPTPVAASNGKLGYHCMVYAQAGDIPTLYWIAPDGETRLLGVMSTNYVEGQWNASNWCGGGLSAPFDKDDPNIFYCVTNDSNRRLLKAVYSGHTTAGQDDDLTNQPYYGIAGLPHTTYTALTPAARSPVVLLGEFNPSAQPYIGTWSFRGSDWGNGKYHFMFYQQQDGLGFFAEYDPKQTAAQQQARFGNTAGCVDNPPVTGGTYAGQAGCIVMSKGSFTGGAGSAFRWSVLHSLAVTEATTYLQATLNVMRVRIPYAYQVTLTSSLSGTVAPCSVPKPAGSIIADWPDSTWAYGCSTITVTGDPKLSGTYGNYPGSLPALPGDFMSADSSAFRTHEIMRLLDKGSDGKTWYIQRQYRYKAPPYSSNIANAVISAGGTLDMVSSGISPDPGTSGISLWIDPETGTEYQDVMPSDHIAFAKHARYGRWTALFSQAQPGMEPERLSNPGSIIYFGLPPFNGAALNISPLYIEAHPSLSIWNPPDAETYNQLVDNHPYYGNSALVQASLVTQVGGKLYRIRGTSVASAYKLTPYFANSGSRAMKEVSGPSAQLATDASTQFQWCVALNTGECYSGSLAGDIYFNAPDIANAYCTDNWTRLQTTTTVPNDICINQSNAMVQAIKMQALTQDTYGLQSRVISNALDKYDQQSNFWSSRAVPDGSWLFSTIAADGGMKLFKVPPRSKYSVQRTQYVPVSISLPPNTAVDNAVVEFGYVEKGKADQFYCTARQESCVAQSAAISSSQPFYFSTTEAGSISGLACRAGCTLTIPAVSDRVVYYRVKFRDAGGRVIAQQLGAQAVQ